MSDGELKAAAAVTHALDMIAALAPPGSRAFWSCHLISPYLYLQRMKCRCLRCPISDNKNMAQKLWCIYDDGPLRGFRLQVSLMALSFAWLIRPDSLWS